jgi:hypothetical protein
MDERTGTVRLLEPGAALEPRRQVTVPRTEVEDAVRADEPVDLFLDVERIADDGGQETQRLALSWEIQDLERLLETANGGDVSLAFDENDLQRLLEADVEAHGMREKFAVATAVIGMAGAGAGAATAAIPVGDAAMGGTPVVATSQAPASEISTGLSSGGGGGASVDRSVASEISSGLPAQQASTAGTSTARPASASEMSTGLVGETPRPPAEISTGIVQEPSAPPAEITTGITAEPTGGTAVSADNPSWAPSPTEGALAAGMILALTAAGFAVRSQRRHPPALS